MFGQILLISFFVRKIEEWGKKCSQNQRFIVIFIFEINSVSKFGQKFW